MISKAKVSNRNAHARVDKTARDAALGFDFALLGLKAGEARTDVIREAAIGIAARIGDASTDESEQSVMLAALATSTYRLLDPRRRRKLIERIQLSMVRETDWDLQKLSRCELVAAEESGGSVTLEQRHSGNANQRPLVIADLVDTSA